MSDLHTEVDTNIDLVNEKRRMKSPDTNQFTKILGEDVR